MTDLAETILIGILTGLAAGAVWDSGKSAWRHREEIANKVKASPQADSIYVASGGPAIPRSGMPTLVVSKDLNISWNVEAPPPSLTRRLEELASWYLHVSNSYAEYNCGGVTIGRIAEWPQNLSDGFS